MICYCILTIWFCNNPVANTSRLLESAVAVAISERRLMFERPACTTAALEIMSTSLFSISLPAVNPAIAGVFVGRVHWYGLWSGTDCRIA